MAAIHNGIMNIVGQDNRIEIVDIHNDIMYVEGQDNQIEIVVIHNDIMTIEGKDNRMEIDDIHNDIIDTEGQENRITIADDLIDILNVERQSNRLEVIDTQSDACALTAWTEPRSEIPRAGKEHIVDYLGEPRKQAVMRVLFWNVRGLGAASKQRVVREIVRKHRCTILLLQETKLETISEALISRLWFDDQCRFAFVPSIGKSGGVAVVWNLVEFVMENIHVAYRFITVVGLWALEQWRCGVMGVYNSCVVPEQVQVWLEIHSFLNSMSIPWCIRGDFNMVLSDSERWGRSSVL
ncbi:hypothetical protein V6N11_063486 [Hibiscus sabdariffa]|uniref:Endonuclease/exonuclease/phosphatase domain-containing protein n=1 Tax=Hibiscus sabdariffa TaxID=183260 RepID=A0ABR1ZYG3_9ROSI